MLSKNIKTSGWAQTHTNTCIRSMTFFNLKQAFYCLLILRIILQHYKSQFFYCKVYHKHKSFCVAVVYGEIPVSPSSLQPLKQVFGGWQTEASRHKEASGPHNHASASAQRPLKHPSKTTHCTMMEKSHRAEKATSFGWFECVTDIILATSNAFCYHCYMPCPCAINGWVLFCDFQQMRHKSEHGRLQALETAAWAIGHDSQESVIWKPNMLLWIDVSLSTSKVTI